jgi:putative addiction module component (TIGR02574 family)
MDDMSEMDSAIACIRCQYVLLHSGRKVRLLVSDGPVRVMGRWYNRLVETELSRGRRGVLYTGAMTKAEIKRQVMELPEEERLEVADAIWASLEDPDALLLPQWQRALLDERLSGLDSDEGRDWEDVKAEIWPATR